MTASDGNLPRIAPALLNRLIDADDELPEDLRDALLAAGAEAVSPLIALFQDDSLDAEEAGGEGWARVHAADLLGEIGDSAAIEPLLRGIDALHVGDPLYEAVSLALPRFGSALIEPALSLLSEAPRILVRETVCAALADCGVRDERIYLALESLFDAVVGLGAMAFAAYGDSRALPRLEQGIRAGELDPDPRLALAELDALGEAYRTLAGEVPSELQGIIADRCRPLNDAVERGDYPEDLDDEFDEDSDAVPEFTVTRELDRHPDRPWLWVSTCASPDCECRLAKVIVARREEDVEAVVSIVAESWEDARVPELDEALRGAITAVEVDIDSGATAPPPWWEGSVSSEGGGATDGGDRPAPFPIQEIIDGRLLDELQEQWLNGKGLEPASTEPGVDVLERLSSWKSGELIPYHLAFERARLDYYEDDQSTYVVIDHHCPEPNCTCGEVTLEWQSVGDEASVVGEVCWAPGTAPVFDGKRKELLRDLWARFIARHPDYPARLRARSRQMQRVGAELVKLAKARRRQAPPRAWVSGSKKGRRGGPAKGGTPRR